MEAANAAGWENMGEADAKETRLARLNGPIVLIEDNQDDAFLIKRFLRRSGLRNEILEFESAEAFKLGLAHAPERLLLIILALSLKIDSGLELLKWIRRDERFARTLIVAVGNSALSADIQAALDLGANAYYTKGIDLSELAATVLNLEFIQD